jgi:fatty-acyl-CoA synthase
LSFEPLTPTAYLDRSADVFAERTAVIDGARRFTYAQLRDRALRQAGLLASRGVRPGDRVAVLGANSHLLLESHYGVLYAGAVLVALNVRLAAAELGYIVTHSGSRVLLHDPALSDLAGEIAAQVPGLALIAGDATYEVALASSPRLRVPVDDERGLICLNYTSGTTGRPKGVMYHHRGAYLQALAMTSHFALDSGTVYLWTLPMFHCNGWCFTWAVTSAGGTHVCLRQVRPEPVWQLLRTEGVTHLCAAPTVLSTLVHDPSAPARLDGHVVVAVGGAPPSPSLLARCAEVGFDVTHLYGLTETFGPVVICDWRSEWDELAPADQAVLRARQGVGNVISLGARVVDDSGADVPRDGQTLGEIALRGNNIMLGYFEDEEATRTAVPDGWLRTGDLGVLHPDGYLELKDRAKDIIISGGENISSVEVEAALQSHPAVLEAAVVAVPDERWGERPAALATLAPGAGVTEDELKTYLRTRLAGFKVPDVIRFGELPKTATGKIQKFRLRDDEGWLHAR